MKYYSHIPYQYTDVNKLDGAIKQMLREFDDFLFDVKMLPVIKSSITNVIEQLNKEHHRCKPVSPTWRDTEDHVLNDRVGYKKRRISLYLSNNEYNAALTIVLCREESDL